MLYTVYIVCTKYIYRLLHPDYWPLWRTRVFGWVQNTWIDLMDWSANNVQNFRPHFQFPMLIFLQTWEYFHYVSLWLVLLSHCLSFYLSNSLSLFQSVFCIAPISIQISTGFNLHSICLSCSSTHLAYKVQSLWTETETETEADSW